MRPSNGHPFMPASAGDVTAGAPLFPFAMPSPLDPSSLLGVEGGGTMGVMRMTVIRTGPQAMDMSRVMPVAAQRFDVPEPPRALPPSALRPQREAPPQQGHPPMTAQAPRRAPRPMRSPAQEPPRREPPMIAQAPMPAAYEAPPAPAPKAPPPAQHNERVAPYPHVERPAAMARPEPRPPRDMASRAAPPRHEVTSPAEAALGRRVIPEAFMRPWELRLSREEAIYDMHAEGRRSRILSLVERVRNKLDEAAELRKWHVMLAGKSADEQLWAVRPPRGGLTDPLVREWARRTLEGAGYDAASMLAEWEIFWRRKGI